MARSVGITGSLFVNQSVFDDFPLSVSGWIRPSTSDVQCAWTVLPSSGSGDMLYLGLDASLIPEVIIRESLAQSSASGPTNGALNTWQQIGGVFKSTSLAAVLDGVVGTPVAHTKAPSTLAKTTINNASFGVNGRTAEWAVWNVELTAAEWASLYAAGPLAVSPLLVRPDALVAYWRLLEDDDDRDLVGSYHLTPSFVSGYAQHPPVIAPSAPRFTFVKPAAGIRPSAIASAEGFGTARIAHAIAPSGIASAEAFGSAILGALISPSGIASAEACGTAVLSVDNTLAPSAIASAEAFGAHFVGGKTIVPTGIASAEAVGGPGLTVRLKKRLRPQCPVFASDRPFEGQGLSVYATVGDEVLYRTPRVVRPRFRRHRRIWTKGTTPRLPLGTNPIAKTTRRAFDTGTAGDELDIALQIPSAWASEEIVIDVRHYRDDVENLATNLRTVRVQLNGSLAEVQEIQGTAILIDPEIRAGGIVRLKWRWIPALDGVQPTLFRAMRTAGPTSPADVTVTASGAGRYEVDTPALNSAAYTYKIRAEVGAVTKDVLTGITFTADAAGPPAVTQIMTDAR